jgi:hypothetical protein
VNIPQDIAGPAATAGPATLGRGASTLAGRGGFPSLTVYGDGPIGGDDEEPDVEQTPENRVFALVGVAARVALVLTVAGSLLAATAPLDRTTPALLGGLALDLAGLGTAACCLWHGARNAHERGRAFAVAALFAGLCGAAFAMAGPYFRTRFPEITRDARHTL